MLITNSSSLARFAPSKRIWQGIPSIAGTKDGRLFATFYSGGRTEMIGNYCLLLMSDDGGKTWIDPVAAACPDNDTSERYYDPEVWIDPDGRLWWLYAAAKPFGVFAYVCEKPDEKTLTFGEKRKVGTDVMMDKPTVLRDGTWLLPIAVWNHGVEAVREATRDKDDPEERGSFVYASTDGGRTFVKRGGADVKDRLYDEHAVIEKNDGTLEMYVRTTYGIGKSVSADGGYTWGEGYDSGLGGPCSRFFIRRLRSGRWLLVNHVDCGKERKNLAAMLSEDEGKTWSAPFLLDERQNVSYPDGFEDESGVITVTYDRERGGYKKTAVEALAEAREILFARFTEEDIFAGHPVSDVCALKQIVSKLGAYDGDAEALYAE